MDLFTAALAFGFYFISGSNTAIPTQQQTFAPRVEWKCEAPDWVEPLMYSGSRLNGAVSARCRFTGVAKQTNGLPDLESHLSRRLMVEAKQIHEGPVTEKYLGMPSNRYDVTSVITADGESLTVRQDLHLASNGIDRLVSHGFSKTVSGTGNAAYFRRLDSELDVRATSAPRDYTMRILSRISLAKPGLVPSGYFREEVRKQIEKRIPQTEKELIEDIAAQL